MASREPEAQSAASNGPRLSSVPLAYDLATTADQADLEGSTASAEESASMQRLPLIRRMVEVRKGDSLLSLLDVHAVTQSTGLTAISRLRPRLDPKRIKAGDRVSFVLDENDEHVTLEELTVARTGQRGLHHHWASQTFEPGDVVDAESVSETPGEVASQVVSAANPDGGSKAGGDAENAPLFRHTMTVRSGDSLLGLLQSNEVPASDALTAIRRMKPNFDPSRLQIGDRVSFLIDSPRLSEREKAESRVLELSILRNAVPGKIHQWSSGESFSGRPVLEIVDGIAGLEAPEIEPAELVHVEGQIAASFYRAAEAAGVAPGEIRKIVQILSSRINFRRDIQRGDQFEALLQRQPGGPAKILFVALRNGSRNLNYYRADFADGSSGYFDAEGRSSLNLISTQPVAEARISSKFGYRIHPIYGKRHLHTGVDFRAPNGTPIRAAGSGVVIVKGWRGGYGRYLRIRHNGSYTTAYAHLRGYAKGISPGAQVKSGQIIGYVGSSGVSTGAHLHFEVLKDGKHIDPMTLRKLPSPTLTGDLLTAFLGMRDNMDETLERMRVGSLASAD